MKLRRSFVISFAVAAYVSLRLIPILIFGYLSTDSWPMLYNVKALVAHTPVPIDSDVFDGYNNLWPATMLLSSMYLVVSGVDTVSLELLMPFVSCVSILFIYIVYRRFGARIAAVFVALNSLHIYVAGTVTKEALAIVYMTQLLYIIAVRTLYVPYTLLLIALAMSHHFTSFIYVTFSIVNALLNPGKKSICNAVASTAVVSLYNRFYGLSRMHVSGGVGGVPGEVNIAQNPALVHAAFISLASLAAFCARRGGVTSIMLAAALAISIYVLYVAGVMNLVYIPYAVLALAAAANFSRSRCPVMYAFATAVAAIVAESFAVGNSTVIERAVNFAVIGLYAFIPLEKRSLKPVLALAAALQVFPEVLAAVTLDPALGGHQFYFRSEVESAKSLATLGACIDGDVRVHYLSQFIKSPTCLVVNVLTKYNLVTRHLVHPPATHPLPSLEQADVVFYGGVVAYVNRA